MQLAADVNLLVLKGLASEHKPIDHQGTAPQISLGGSPCNGYQPHLRIPTRSADSSPPRHVAGCRLVYSSLPDSRVDTANGGRRFARRLIYTRIHRLPAQRNAAEGMGVCAEGVLGRSADARGGCAARLRVLPAGDRTANDFWRTSWPMAVGRLFESDHLPGGSVHRTGGRCRVDSEQLPCVRTARRDSDLFQPGIDHMLVRHRIPADFALGSGRVSVARRRAGGRDFDRRRDSALHANSRLGQARNETVAALFAFRSGRAQSGTSGGAGILRHGRLSDQHVRRHDFRRVVAHARRQHHVAVRGGPGDAAGTGQLRHRDVHGAFADHVASMGRGTVERNEAHVRVFAAHRFVHHDSGGGRTDFASPADHSGAVSARALHCRIDGADDARAFLLFAGAAGVCRCKADRPDVLLDAGHGDAGDARAPTRSD